MKNPSVADEASHYLRNLDSLVRMRIALGDDKEETIKLLKDRGADEYLISLIVPCKKSHTEARTDAEQISEKSRRLFMRAQEAQTEAQRQRSDMRRLIGEVRQTRNQIGAKLRN